MHIPQLDWPAVTTIKHREYAPQVLPGAARVFARTAHDASCCGARVSWRGFPAWRSSSDKVSVLWAHSSSSLRACKSSRSFISHRPARISSSTSFVCSPGFRKTTFLLVGDPLLQVILLLRCQCGVGFSLFPEKRETHHRQVK